MHRRVDLVELASVDEWVTSLVPQPGWLSFLTHRVGLDATIVAARLLWPRFAEISGCVVIDGLRTASEVQSWLEATDGDVSRSETILNTLHLWDVFPSDSPSELDSAALTELMYILEATWRGALSAAYPDRRFEVHAVEDDSQYGPTVTFFSEARRARP